MKLLSSLTSVVTSLKHNKIEQIKILIIDDNHMILEYFKLIINKLNKKFKNIKKIVADYAESFEDGLNFLSENDYDRVISDLRLNDNKTGIELLKTAKEKGIKQLILITAVSTSLLDELELVNQIIRKPLLIDDIIAVIGV